ncbi:aminotransferase class I/II-fold pyridoxal phosphate-dependent enzyme [Niallia sp. 01092]|uniref:aminotransferase class I/II-fold pyridoxal phosphate-dependent enzyme n=1 Tax=unclassified Niallia TaxID=2837522 RepID=UPI003FD5CA38
MVQFQQSSIVNSLPPMFFFELVEKVARYRAKGIDIIDFGRGNPDQPTPVHIVEALKGAVDIPSNHGYAPHGGKLAFKQAIQQFYKEEYDVDLDIDSEITVFAGSVIGLAEIGQCLLEPGDVLMTTDPSYPIYHSTAKVAQAQVHTLPLTEARNFLPTYEDVMQDVAARTKLLMLNYPNNPTGAVATASFFEETVAFAKQHHIAVFHDFAYGAFGFDGEKPRSFLQTEGAKEYGIEVYTLSKTFNMAGWRVAFAVGNASIIRALNNFQDHTASGLFGAVQDAASAALNGPKKPVQELKNLYETRRNTLVTTFKDIGWEIEPSKGSFFVWAKIPALYTSEAFAEKLLVEAHVAVAPGTGFGPGGEGYVRLGLLESEDRIREAARRIANTGIFDYALLEGKG